MDEYLFKLSMKKILIVEDDENYTSIVEHILTNYGFEVYAHSTGVDVPEIVKKYNPDWFC